MFVYKTQRFSHCPPLQPLCVQKQRFYFSGTSSVMRENPPDSSLVRCLRLLSLADSKPVRPVVLAGLLSSWAERTGSQAWRQPRGARGARSQPGAVPGPRHRRASTSRARPIRRREPGAQGRSAGAGTGRSAPR